MGHESLYADLLRNDTYQILDAFRLLKVVLWNHPTCGNTTTGSHVEYCIKHLSANIIEVDINAFREAPGDKQVTKFTMVHDVWCLEDPLCNSVYSSLYSVKLTQNSIFRFLLCRTQVLTFSKLHSTHALLYNWKLHWNQACSSTDQPWQEEDDNKKMKRWVFHLWISLLSSSKKNRNLAEKLFKKIANIMWYTTFSLLPTT